MYSYTFKNIALYFLRILEIPPHLNFFFSFLFLCFTFIVHFSFYSQELSVMQDFPLLFFISQGSYSVLAPLDSSFKSPTCGNCSATFLNVRFCFQVFLVQFLVSVYYYFVSFSILISVSLISFNCWYFGGLLKWLFPHAHSWILLGCLIT